MNKNKIIFLVIWVIIVLLLGVLLTNLNKKETKTVQQKSTGDFYIWILHDRVSDFWDFIAGFKAANPEYAGRNIVVESFSDELTYTNTLSAAISADQAPDLFVLSNSETSQFENQILGIDPAAVSPNDFRLRFKPVFWDDLILSDESDSSIEFLKWIPAWYESLGIFYNRKFFLRPSEIGTWTDFAQEVRSIAQKHSNVIPIALGNGSGVSRAAEIITSLFVLEGKSSLVTTDSTESRQVLAMYNGFGQRDGENRYNILSAPFVRDKDIDFFTKGDVAAMIWYPRDLLAIDEIWYQKSFLFATPFPGYAWEEKLTSISYNYFAINKDTSHRDLALWFLSFLASSDGQQLYSDTFPYYLSGEVNVATNMTEKKILPQYNIVYKNFVSEDDILVSYDLGNKNTYQLNIPRILDLDSWFDSEFNELSSYITCSSTKQNTLLNLSSPCR